MQSVSVKLIAAVALNGAIGRNNSLMWHIKEDLRFFKETTWGGCVIMGHKTFDSMGRPLPGRLNIVVSQSAPVLPEEVRVAPGLQEAFEICRSEGKEECFVIGGGSVYSQAMGYADTLLITRVFVTPEDADTFFPPIEADEWDITEQSDIFTDGESGIQYRFETYNKQKPNNHSL